MTIHHLTHVVPEWLAHKLEEFEDQFSYPLGPKRFFRISHGRNYLTFFQAIGEAHLFVAERDQQLQGTLVAVKKPLRLPDGTIKEVGYLCDLKVSPLARTGRTLLRLMQSVRDQLEIPCGGMGYATVMDGTARTPERYSRPEFRSVAQMVVLRIATGSQGATGIESCEPSALDETHQKLTAGACVPLSGTPTCRSQVQPIYLRTVNGDACGVLEDTRRGKRLWDDAGQEMLSAHLSRFAFASAEQGAQLLRAALCEARAQDFPALFTAVPKSLAESLVAQLPIGEVVLAPATIYARGLPDNSRWWIDTAEI